MIQKHVGNASSSNNSFVSSTRSQVTKFNATGLIHSHINHLRRLKTGVTVDCAHMYKLLVNQNLNYVDVVGNFLSQVIFIFPLFQLHIPKNKRKTKITWDKKLTTTYTLGPSLQQTYCPLIV